MASIRVVQAKKRGAAVARHNTAGTANGSYVRRTRVEQTVNSGVRRVRGAAVVRTAVKEAGVDVAAHDHVAVGGEENPGSPDVRATISTGGRLPSGEKKTCLITGASSGLGLHTAKALVKTGDWNVVCAVRDRAKMERQAARLGFPEDSFSVMEVDLKSLDSVRTFCESVKASGIGLDCVVGNAAVYYPMLKDPEKFRLGFHMAGAGSLPANRMGSDARVTADGFEESVGVIHLAHFLMFQLLVDSVAEHGRRVNHAPRMIIVGSITHNPDELAGKIPPQANLGDCDGLLNGLKVADGNVMIDGKRFDGPKAYKDAKASNMLTIFEMHRRFHEQTGIIFNTMYPGCIADTPLFRNHYPAFQKLFPAFQKFITGGYVSVEEAGERLASVCTDPEYDKSGCYWSWVGGVRGANGATQDYNKDDKGMGGKFENKVSKEVANSTLAKTLFDASEVAVGLKQTASV